MQPQMACIIFINLMYMTNVDVGASRIQDEIYVNLGAFHHCFRLLNGTHETGCQSPMDGISGVIQFVENQADAIYISQDPQSRGPFIAALSLQTFRDSSLVHKLTSSVQVNGLLVLHIKDDPVIPKNFSEDLSCPNRFSSLYQSDETDTNDSACHDWNSAGTDFRMINWKMPIFYIYNETEIRFIVDICHHKLNRRKNNWPLCAAQLSTFFYAAQSTETCMRRNNLFAGLQENEKICDPVQDLNIFALVPPRNKSGSYTPGNVICLLARMDSFSMFLGAAYGAASSLAHLVVTLAIADAIGRTTAAINPIVSANTRRLLIILFNGESLDYIGSSRMVWDMVNSRFPAPLDNSVVNQSALIRFDDIDFLLELNQLVPSDLKKPSYFLHVDQISVEENSTRNIVDKLSQDYIRFSDNMIQRLPAAELPPSSIHSFLKRSRSKPALLLTNHQSEHFENPYYNGFLDTLSYDPSEMKSLVLALTQVANATTRLLLHQLFNASSYGSKFEWVDEEIVSRLSECFFDWPMWNCTLFRNIWTVRSKAVRDRSNINDLMDAARTQTYPSVNASLVRFYSQFLLSYFLGSKENWRDKPPEACEASSFTETKSHGIYSYTYAENVFAKSDEMNDSFCIISTVKSSLALSPAFEIPGYNLADPFNDSAGFYSTWTESRWNKIWLRLFLKPNPLWQWGIFSIGLLSLIISLIFGFIISKSTDVLFAGPAAAL